MKQLEKTDIQLGYIPLLDCIAILWAKYRGFFTETGLNVQLVKEPSWASLRDRLAFGFLDAAHCLSAMLPAAAIGLDQSGIPFQTPLILSTNQAYISLSQKLCFELDINSSDTAQQSAQKVVQAYLQGRPIQLAQVFKYSLHHYCLREWLALADEQVAQQFELKTLPPPYMVEAVSNHLIDGFCAGEPWNTQGELQGYSKIITSSQTIIPKVADKVLAVTAEWASQHPNTLTALVEAIQKAQYELKQMQDYQQIWQLLIHYNIIRFQCSAEIHVDRFYFIQNIIQNFIGESAQPQLADFIWLTEKMLKWEQLDSYSSDFHQLGQSCIYKLQY